MLLSRVMGSLDKDIEDAAKAVAGGKDPDASFRLQRLMERRTQMFNLLSNMSAKFNEMTKTAIQNMSRA